MKILNIIIVASSMLSWSAYAELSDFKMNFRDFGGKQSVAVTSDPFVVKIGADWTCRAERFVSTGEVESMNLGCAFKSSPHALIYTTVRRSENGERVCKSLNVRDEGTWHSFNVELCAD